MDNKEFRQGGYLISTDHSLLNADYIHDYLCNQSYWAKGIPIETVRRSIEGSLCFGMYDKEKQIGFARVITDKATFGYLADVFIDENYRGKGLSKWLMQVIMSYPGLQGLRRLLLATRDAHGLYAKYGFQELTNPQTWMQLHKPEVYKKSNK
jgi:GNAT superfamily N-acetyltransferase